MTPIDFRARVERLAAALDRSGLAAYVGTRQAALHWINGAFAPWRGAVVVTAKGHCELLYWAMDAERLRAEGAGFPVRPFHRSEFVRNIVEVLAGQGISSGRIGLDLSHPGAAQVAPGMLTAQEYLDLQSLMPDARLVNGVDPIDELMLIKDEAEMERLRRAAEVSDAGLRAGLEALRPGVTENEVAGAIEMEIRRRGSTWAWAVTGGTEVGAGERTAFLHGVTQQATDRRIRADEFVILDLHPMIDLYLSDFALPVFLGTPTSEQERLIACWEEAVEAVYGSLVPGTPISACAEAGIAVFRKRGFEAEGLPLFGHGLGTCARTRPFLNPWSTDVVTPGMVVALGCHLYVPGLGGARLEYPVAIGPNGPESLSKIPPKVLRKAL